MVFEVARVTTDMLLLSHWEGAVDRSRGLFVLAPSAKLIVHRFGVKILVPGDPAMATSLRQRMIVEALVPRADVHRWWPYGATATLQPPHVPARFRGSVLDVRRHFVHITPEAAAPFGWALDEPFLRCNLPSGLPRAN